VFYFGYGKSHSRLEAEGRVGVGALPRR
jgi:hypothetical protein